MRPPTRSALLVGALLALLSGSAAAQATAPVLKVSGLQLAARSAADCKAGTNCLYFSTDNSLHLRLAGGSDAAIGGSSSITINTTSPLGGGGTGSTFTLTCTLCIQTSDSPTATGTWTFNNAVKTAGVTSPASTTLAITSGQADGTTAAFVFSDPNQFTSSHPLVTFSSGTPSHLSLDIQVTNNGTALYFYNPTSSALEGGFISTSSPYLQFYGWTYFYPYYNNTVQFGGSSNYWAGVYSAYYSGHQQAATTTGAVSITTTNGGTARISQSGNVTSIILTACVDDQKFTLIIVGNGGTGPSTITNAKLIGGTLAWPGNAVRQVSAFSCDTTDSQWLELSRSTPS